MKHLLSATLLASLVTLTPPALAAPPEACEHHGLIQSLSAIRGGTQWLVVLGPREARLERLPTPGTPAEIALRVTCDTIEIPAARDLAPRPTGPAPTLTRDGLTLSKTARGLISLDTEAGAADPDALHFTLTDDASVSFVRGERLVFSAATLPDGAFVTREGRGFGCGCEKIHTPDGKLVKQALPAPRVTR